MNNIISKANICLITVFLLSMTFLSITKPAFILKVVNERETKINIPLLILYSILFATASSMAFMLYFYNEKNINVGNKSNFYNSNKFNFHNKVYV